MEYLTQFKKFLKTNNGSDTSWHNQPELFSSSLCRTPSHTLTDTHTHTHKQTHSLVVYGNCVMTVNDGATSRYA